MINNATLAVIMKEWFLSFAIQLDPNVLNTSGIAKPYWPTYTAPNSTNFTIMDVNYTQIGSVADFDASPQCDFFHGQSYVVRN